MAPAYAELHCHTNFSFLDGASPPDDLVARAVELGLTGLAVTDHQGLYGVVRFATAAEAAGLRPGRRDRDRAARRGGAGPGRDRRAGPARAAAAGRGGGGLPGAAAPADAAVVRAGRPARARTAPGCPATATA